MTLNDLKSVLDDAGFQKNGKSFEKLGGDFDINLSMDLVPSKGLHRMIITLNRHSDGDLMAHFNLDLMFNDDRWYIEDNLRLKKGDGEAYNRFVQKFKDEYLPTIARLISFEGVADLYSTHLKGKGMVTWQLRQAMTSFNGVDLD